MTIDFPAFWLIKIHSEFYKAELIIIYKHLEIYTKTISRLKLSDYKPILTSSSTQWIQTCTHLALGD